MRKPPRRLASARRPSASGSIAHRTEGVAGLEDRSSRPRHSPTITDATLVTAIQQLRTDHGVPAWLIGRALGVPRSTVSAWIRRLGLQRSADHPAAGATLRMAGTRRHAPSRYQAAGPHRSGRPSHPRRSEPAGARRGLGVRACRRRRSQPRRVRRSPAGSTRADVRRVPASGGGVVGASQGHGAARADGQRQRLPIAVFHGVCAELAVRHRRTRPYTPRTNGKAERFIQTLLREWAYATAYEDSRARRQALRPWLRYYNRERPHASLAYGAPWSRLTCVA